MTKSNKYFVYASARAENQLDRILSYVESEFGVLAANKVTLDYLKLFDRLKNTPEMYAFYDRDLGIRKALIRSRLWEFYRIEGEVVAITSIYSTYQNYSPEDVT